MEHKDKVIEIIKRSWGVQYRALGGESVTKLYDSVQEKKSLDELITSAKGGSSFDLNSVWQIMYEAVDFTVNVLALYAIWSQSHKQPPTKEEILQLLHESDQDKIYSQLVIDKLDILIEEITKK